MLLSVRSGESCSCQCAQGSFAIVRAFRGALLLSFHSGELYFCLCVQGIFAQVRAFMGSVYVYAFRGALLIFRASWEYCSCPCVEGRLALVRAFSGPILLPVQFVAICFCLCGQGNFVRVRAFKGVLLYSVGLGTLALVLAYTGALPLSVLLERFALAHAFRVQGRSCPCIEGSFALAGLLGELCFVRACSRAVLLSVRTEAHCSWPCVQGRIALGRAFREALL